jgi:hypothetical protein
MAALVQQWSSLLPAALLDNHGVPGDWVTGSRTLDVLLLPVIFAISFPVLRLLLKKHIYQVCITAPFKQRQLYCQTSCHLKLDTYHACCSSSESKSSYVCRGPVHVVIGLRLAAEQAKGTYHQTVE